MTGPRGRAVSSLKPPPPPGLPGITQNGSAKHRPTGGGGVFTVAGHFCTFLAKRPARAHGVVGGYPGSPLVGMQSPAHHPPPPSCCIMMDPWGLPIVIDSPRPAHIMSTESPASLKSLPSPTVHLSNKSHPPPPRLPSQLGFPLIGRGPVISAWIA